jgi:prepilin-type N-terminal cleavage/methylation domain-containing protein
MDDNKVTNPLTSKRMGGRNLNNIMKNNFGFSLIELMLTICILGILLAISVAGYNEMAVRHELGGASREVLAMMRKARMIAIKEDTSVVVSFDVPNNTYMAFVDDGVGSVDNDHNGIRDNALNFKYDAGERTVISGKMPPHVTITGANFGGDSYFLFDGKGFPLDKTNTLTGGAIGFKDSQGEIRNVTLSLSGHTTIQ